MFSVCIPPHRAASRKTALLAAAAMMIACYRAAISADEPQASGVPAQVSRANDGGNRDPVRDAFERLSEHEIKAFYLRCSREVAERRMDGGEAMMCSVGYDVLLNKHFAGSFESLWAWSRAQ